MEMRKQLVLESKGFKHHRLDVTVGENPRHGSIGLVVIENKTREVIYMENRECWRLRR